ncbi:NAD-dependent epimerase/dehydratase family protein [Tengunoibacter tsumagoiensis]|uniref:Putative UDP-glucose epimerase YtcB n=1 Tax=Tengunoibacter tsumagoiensis TaxID=2014871 RepID=A0A402A0N7_9CHLR|nr:NAD-dependent epimerase/dehydratase family protein [Tengunoibacter tsumagoiensis]GCE12622.1 putative UDP-glucose epimerase YtcB [Tengunoibacter tsumagoiensis]
MRCIVTGVAGFVGSHLAERLLHEGHEVCGIDAFIDYYDRSLKERNLEGPRSWRRFSFVEGNLVDLFLRPLVEGADWIFHQAAQAGVRASWGAEFTRYTECNVLATQRLLEAAHTVGGVKRIVYASSSSIYGDTTTMPISEDAPHHPYSPYGVTKLAAEHLCSLYHHNFGVPTVSLRYFTVYGPRQRPDMAFHCFCKAILTREPLHVFDDGLQTRDFTYVTDIVEANLLAATQEAAIGQVMNIAGGSRVSVQDVLHLLREISGSPFQVVFENKQHGDVRHTFASTERAQTLLGYQPQVPLRKGLAHEFEFARSLYQSSHKQLQIA